MNSIREMDKSRITDFIAVIRTSKTAAMLLASGLTCVLGIGTWVYGETTAAAWAKQVGVGISAFSLLFAVLTTTFQTYSLAILAQETRRIAFNEVTLRIFSAIQVNEKLSHRMRSGELATKKKIGVGMESILVEEDSNFLEAFLVNRNIFIESGSTYAYLALHINNYIGLREPHPTHRRVTFVLTNNLLAYMVLLFRWSCEPRLYAGTPSDKYGATYGCRYDPKQNPQVDGEELFGFLGKGKRAESPEVILMAISRIHLTYGPHVGSFQNAQYKTHLRKYALKHKVPIVMVIDDSKIEEEGKGLSPECYCTHGASSGDGTSARARHQSADDGFLKLVESIGKGELFLFVAYRRDAKPTQAVARLLKRVRVMNKSLQKKVAYTSHPNDSVGLISVHPFDTEGLHCSLSTEMRCAIGGIGSSPNSVVGTYSD